MITQPKSFLVFDVHNFAKQISHLLGGFEYTKLQVFKTPATNGKITEVVF